MMNSEQTVPKKIALYLRVSTEDQKERYGLPLQRECLEGIIKSKGKLANGTDAYVLAGPEYIYSDDGISGTTPLDERPEFTRLKEDIINSPEGKLPFDIVAVYKIDRFARRLRILLDVMDFFEKNGVQFISAQESIDTSNPFGKAIYGIIGVIAELELETIKERTFAGKREAIKNGVFMGNVAPFGFQKDKDKRLIPLPEEAKVVELIFDLFVNNKQTTYAISKYLTDTGYLSPDSSAIFYKKKKDIGKRKNLPNFWRQDTVREILKDEIYVGKYYSNKTINRRPVSKDQWILSPWRYEPIISTVLYGKAQQMLSKSRYLTVPKSPTRHVYLLSGLLRCASCYDVSRDREGMMTWIGERKEKTKGSGNFDYFYNCGRKRIGHSSIDCKSLPFPADEIESYVVKFVKDLIKNPVYVYNYQNQLSSSEKERRRMDDQYNEFRKMLNAIPEQRKRVNELYEESVYDRKTRDEKIKEIDEKERRFQSKMELLEVSINQRKMSSAYIDSFELFNDKYSVILEKYFENREAVYNILHLLIDSITVYTRPLENKEKISGRKKEGQEIPYKIDIKFRLPQEYISELLKKIENDSNSGIIKEEFGVKLATW